MSEFDNELNKNAEALLEVDGVEDQADTIEYCEIEIPPVAEETNKEGKKGLKIFTLCIVFLLVTMLATVVGYYFGHNQNAFLNNSGVELDLAAKPKDTDQYTPAQVYDMLDESVVGIMVYNSSGIGSEASGVIYSEDGYIVTNDHIYSEVPNAKFKVYTHDGKEYDAEYVAGDSISDLAVLKIKNANVKFKVPEFGNSKELVCGENVVAIGRPSDATDNSSITSGIISLTKRRVQTTSSYSANLIQTDSAINPGSSGGALVNMYGQVIGITSSKLAGVDYDAVGFAIPTTTVKRVVDQLISEGKVVDRAKLGISYVEITSVIAELQGSGDVGLHIATVSSDSDLSGKVFEGDIITHINGTKITNDDIVLDVIEECKAGDKIKLTIINSNGVSTVYDVTLKSNIGESSYVSEGSNSSGGGTFDFPSGE